MQVKMAEETKHVENQCVLQQSLITGLSFVFPRLVLRDGKDEECGALAGSCRAAGMVLWGSVICE